MLSLPQVPVLFNGCRSGEIFSFDLRQRSRKGQSWKASRFYQESAITSIRLLQDENYLLAADMLGQVSLSILFHLNTVNIIELMLVCFINHR